MKSKCAGFVYLWEMKNLRFEALGIRVSSHFPNNNWHRFTPASVNVIKFDVLLDSNSSSFVVLFIRSMFESKWAQKSINWIRCKYLTFYGASFELCVWQRKRENYKKPLNFIRNLHTSQLCIAFIYLLLCTRKLYFVCLKFAPGYQYVTTISAWHRSQSYPLRLASFNRKGDFFLLSINVKKISEIFFVCVAFFLPQFTEILWIFCQHYLLHACVPHRKSDEDQ